MKKRTVITTEKREVWVIRQPSVEGVEHETDNSREESSPFSAPTDELEELDSPSDEQI